MVLLSEAGWFLYSCGYSDELAKYVYKTWAFHIQIDWTVGSLHVESVH